jgi:hypothetical protein
MQRHRGVANTIVGRRIKSKSREDLIFGFMLVPVLRAKKIEKLGFFLSQHLTNHFALPIRDVAISEKLLVQGNIFLVDKFIEGNHNAPPLPQY